MMGYSKQETKLLLENRSPLKLKQQQSLTQQEILEAESIFIYGKKVNIVNSKGKLRPATFFQIEDLPCYLFWTSETKQQEDCKLRLTDILNIDDNPQKKVQQIKQKYFICFQLKNQDEKELVICFQDQKEQRIWREGFKKIFQKANEIETEEKMQDDFRHLAQNIFNKADEDGDRTLNYQETEMLLKSLHVKINKKYMGEIFKKFDTDGSGTIDLEEFKNILKNLMKKKELQGVYEQYCSNQTKEKNTSQRQSFTESEMTVQCLQNFLEQEQDHQIDMQGIKKNIQERSLKQKQNNSSDTENLSIDFYQFTNFIFNIENSIFNPEMSNLYQNMCRPLSDYYIASSHNTYLSSDQLVGDSDINCYKRALLKGCRCVELDTWDGNKEPIITHGHTLTSKIQLIEVLQVIQKYAFQTSPYPVILSFENHCSKAQTKIIAQQCKKIFGNALYTLPLNYDHFKYFKSPHSLKYKIIIKSKSNIYHVTDFNSQDLAFDNFMDQEKFEKTKSSQKNLGERRDSLQELQKKELKMQKINNVNKFNNQNQQSELEGIQQQQSYRNRNRNTSIGSYQTQFQDQNNPFQHGWTKQRELQFSNKLDDIINKLSDQDLDDAQNLQNMLVIQDESDQENEDDDEDDTNAICDAEIVNVTTMFGTKMKDKKDNRTCFHISSIDEDKTEKFAYSKDQEKIRFIVDFHKQNFSRIYPKGTRVDSSNYNPIPGFSIGSQIIALNYQTLDHNLMVYLSKFQQNGGVNSGYVLKPEWQRSDCREENKKYIYDFNKPIKQLNLQIISGQSLEYDDKENDKRSYISPYVKVEIRGIPIDEKHNVPIRTKVVPKNNLDPLFEESGEFKIHCPDCAFIEFQVLDDNNSNKLISWYSLPFECIRKGYRVVPLFNHKTNLIEHSYLLVKVSITDL